MENNARQLSHLESTLVVFVVVEWDGTLSSVKYVESGPTIAAQDCEISTKQESFTLFVPLARVAELVKLYRQRT